MVIDEISDYPAGGKVEINIQSGKPESFSLSLRIPEWSENTVITVNGTPVADIKPGTYKEITRIWNTSDKVIINFDMTARLVKLNGQQAIIRGPVVLARDNRFKDGFIYESAVINQKDGKVEVETAQQKPKDIWMAFTAPLILGTDLEGEFSNPKQIHFCDFASAGNTWGEDSRYRVWIPQTLNVMKTEYKGY